MGRFLFNKSNRVLEPIGGNSNNYSLNNFIGTRTEWDSLSADERSKYGICNFVDFEPNSTITFRRSIENINYLNPYDFNEGDVVLDTSDNTIYILSGNNWEPLTQTGDLNYSSSYDDFSKMELVETRCVSCGAPIKIRTRYDTTVRCEYCGMIYRIEHKRN